MLYSGSEPLLRAVVASIGAYLWLLIVLRISGKRSLSKLNAFDFAITVAFGSALSSVILSKDVSLAEGAVALAMLALLQYVVSQLSILFPPFRRLVRSRPTLLVEDGCVLEEALRHERITRDELDEAARMHGLASLEEARAIVLETDGSFSVIRGGGETIPLLRSVRRIS